MTRRLTLLVVGLVAAALVLAGVGSLVLQGFDQRRETRAELAGRADAVAALLVVIGNRVPEALPAIRRALALDDIVVVEVGADVAAEQALPDAVALSLADVAALRRGDVVSHIRGSTVFAAAPVRGPIRGAVILTRHVPLVSRSAGRWLAVAGVGTLAAAAAAGMWSARRILRPLRSVDEATRRIAAGDLAARADVPGGQETEVTALARSVNAMGDALERSRAVERNFLLSVSHDLRTPLTSIRGWAEALADGAAEDPVRAARIVEAETRRLERLVEDLLELAKLDARHLSLRPEPIDVGELVAATAEGFLPAVEEAGLALAVRAGGPVPAVLDPDRLAQVVANLVENALKHAGSRVEVTVTAVAGHVEISVADDGAGIGPDDLPHVFERLYAGARPARRAVGSGLGLAIVAELVAAMAGSVAASSPAGAGTTITVRLPTT